MALYPGIRQTHTWLRPLFDYLEGKNLGGQLQLGSPTSIMGLYGATGAAKLSTNGVGGAGLGFFSGATGAGISIGPSGSAMYNGGTGTFVGVNDVVRALKNLGVLPA